MEKSYGNLINKVGRLSHYSLSLSPIWKCNNKHTFWFAVFIYYISFSPSARFVAYKNNQIFAYKLL